MMNPKLYILPIARAALAPNTSKTFRYLIDKDTKYTTGLLCTNDAQFSVSFLDGKELEINSFETLPSYDTVAPSKRILTWRQDLENSRVLIGSITNIKTQTQNVSLYLLTFKNSLDEN